MLDNSKHLISSKSLNIGDLVVDRKTKNIGLIIKKGDVCEVRFKDGTIFRGTEIALKYQFNLYHVKKW